MRHETRRSRVFSTFLKCSQMSGVFYHSVIHGFNKLRHMFYDIDVMSQAKNNNTCFFYVLYSDKTWVFDQSECVQGPV